jgi:hypothetical protein
MDENHILLDDANSSATPVKCGCDLPLGSNNNTKDVPPLIAREAMDKRNAAIPTMARASPQLLLPYWRKNLHQSVASLPLHKFFMLRPP